MPELEIRHEMSAGKERSADSRADRKHKHNTVAVFARAVLYLSHSSGVGVVDNPRLAAASLADKLGKVRADKFLSAQIRGGLHNLRTYDPRESATDYPVPFERLRYLRNGIDNRLGLVRFRGRNAHALADKFAFFDVDNSAFDARTADVYTQNVRFLHSRNFMLKPRRQFKHFVSQPKQPPVISS